VSLTFSDVGFVSIILARVRNRLCGLDNSMIAHEGISTELASSGGGTFSTPEAQGKAMSHCGHGSSKERADLSREGEVSD
jgi:hypothetical protein